MIDGGVDAKRVVGAEEVETAVSRLRYYGLINVLVSCRKKSECELTHVMRLRGV